MGGGVGDLAGAALGAFGGDSGEPSSGSSSSASGYNALPPTAQHSYDNLFSAVGNVGNQNVNPFQYTTVQRPNSIFDSQELYNLQQATPNTPIRPTGLIEPFNSVQQSALSQLSNPDFSQSAMQQYTNPYQQAVLNTTMDAINRQAATNKANIMSNNSLLNSRANSSSLGTQLAQNDKNTSNLVANAAANLGYQGYNSGLDLRNQSLQQQLGAGSAIQGLNQQYLSASNPAGAYSMLPDYLKASLLSPLFSAYPQSSVGSSTQTGATPPRANSFGQAGGAALALGSPGEGGNSIFSDIFG